MEGYLVDYLINSETKINLEFDRSGYALDTNTREKLLNSLISWVLENKTYKSQEELLRHRFFQIEFLYQEKEDLYITYAKCTEL